MLRVTFTLAILSFAAGAQPIRYVDLSVPLKAAAKSRPATAGNQGGGCFDCPTPGFMERPPLPLSLKLVRFVESTDPVPGTGAIEVLLTNTSKKSIRIPVGVDVASLLDTPAPERRGLSFGVCVSPCRGGADIIGGREAVTNESHPETALELRPGESIIFKLPFDQHAAAERIRLHGDAQGELSAFGGFFSIQRDKDGEYSQSTGETIQSVNSLKAQSPEFK